MSKINYGRVMTAGALVAMLAGGWIAGRLYSEAG